MPGPRRGAGGAHFSRALIARCAVLGRPLLRVCRMPPVPIQADHGRAPARQGRPVPGRARRPGHTAHSAARGGARGAVRLCAVCGLWSVVCRVSSAVRRVLSFRAFGALSSGAAGAGARPRRRVTGRWGVAPVAASVVGGWSPSGVRAPGVRYPLLENA
ncbi:hypothetical protein SMALB_8374 [Streptomyces malaysiensis]|uniref:Uncharacterized protein n=1 Tax=Streptomyces malaysiensis TaxID=92644 RepID=A0A7X5XBL5_STRMQ|nr:hypothetical protein [Streptomyces malaysiensis]